jgi:hypothetical protein
MDFVTVTECSLTTNVATLTVATLYGLRAGYTVAVQGVGAPYDGTVVLTGVATDTTVDPEVYTVTYALVNINIASDDVDGRITPVCTWITDVDVEGFLGISPASQLDADYLTQSPAAGNDWASRRRRAAGYDDWADTLPSADVFLGTVLYAAAVYRERGSVDSYASFSDMGPVAPIGTNMRVLQLLGLNKPKVW